MHCTRSTSNIEMAIRKGMEDEDATVRTTAVGLLHELNISADKLPGIVDPIFKRGSVQEQQELLLLSKNANRKKANRYSTA